MKNYEDVKKEVNIIMQKAHEPQSLQDIEHLDKIDEELVNIMQPLKEQMAILSQDEKVARYKELLDMYDCVREKQKRLSSYYPK